MNNKGFTLVELLIAASLLVVITLSLSGFSSSILDVSAKHSRQVESAKASRFSTERIPETIRKADYIYPNELELNLTINDDTTGNTQDTLDAYTINTSNSVALLIHNMQDMDSGDDHYYYAIVYFIAQNQTTGNYDLYEFSTPTPFEWEDDTLPSENITSFDGNLTTLATGIDKNNCVLSYILNYDNGITDTALLGEVGNVTTSSSNALIKGLDWKVELNNDSKQVIYVKGISKNVPRT